MEREQILNQALIRKLCLQQLSQPHDFKERFLKQWREYWEEFRRVLKENPSLAWTVRIGVPLLVMLSWIGVIIAYNMYSLYRTNCEYYYSQIGVEIRRRDDLIPNLAACVSRYSAHEQEIMKHVADARQALSGPGDIRTKMAAAKAMESALARLLALAEQYPDLKAAQPVQLLLQELSNTENRIADWKGKYNESARVFNNMRTSIPTNYLGWCFGIRKLAPYINTDEDMMRVYMLKFAEEQRNALR